MLYHFLKPLIHLYFKIFFKKIYFTGLENLTQKKSVVFAVNHPTAFLDPIIIAANIRPSTHFMLRGDIFTSPVIKFLLNQIKTIPIFRARDGFSAVKNNYGTFEIVYEKLHQGENILILAEGIAKHEKKMRPIQKGAARMVFGAYEKYPDLDAIIIPVGVNYTNSDGFRSMMMVDFGPAIKVADYYSTHAENPRKAIKQLTDEISDRMYKSIIHIDEDEDAKFTEGLLEIYRHNMHHKVIPVVDKSNRKLLETEKLITETINKMEAAPKSKLKEQVEAYLAKLKSAGIKDIGLAQKQRYSFINTLILIIGFLPYCLGFVGNILPLALGRWVADAKVTKIEFHSSVRFGIGMISYIFYFIILLIVLALLWSWMGVLYAFLIPVFGRFSLFYRDFYLLWKEAKVVAGQESTFVLDLQKERTLLLTEILERVKI